MKLFENYIPTSKNFEELVKLAIEKDPMLSIILTQKDGKKVIRADYEYEYGKGEYEDGEPEVIIWSEYAGECAKRLFKGEYPSEILAVV